MKEREVTQEELEERSGVSQSSISNIARGESLEGVTAVTIARLSLALNVSPGFLLLAEEDKVPELRQLLKEGQPIELDESRDQVAAPSRKPAARPKGRRSAPGRP